MVYPRAFFRVTSPRLSPYKYRFFFARHVSRQSCSADFRQPWPYLRSSGFDGKKLMVKSMLENADRPPAFSTPPYRARNRRFCDAQRRVSLSFCFTTNGQQPPGGDGNRHPQPVIVHALVLPLPTAPFAAFEARVGNAFRAHAEQMR